MKIDSVARLQEFIEREGEPALCPCGKGYVGHSAHTTLECQYGNSGFCVLHSPGVHWRGPLTAQDMTLCSVCKTALMDHDKSHEWVDSGVQMAPFEFDCVAFEDADFSDDHYVRSNCGKRAVVVRFDEEAGLCAQHLPIVKAMPLDDLAKFLPLAWANVQEEGDAAFR